MDAPEPIITLLIVAVTAIVSIRAFKDERLRGELIFSPESILAGREYHRIVSSALVHADSAHLWFNMLSLYVFGYYLEPLIHGERLVVIYLAGIVGGSLLSLVLHRRQDYQALGASGGVCGLIFASIFLLPGGAISLLGLPFGVPSWLYAVLFLAVQFKGLRSPDSRIGHDAHLGGAIIGLLVATAFYPSIVSWNPGLYAAVLGLSGAIFVWLWRNPLQLPVRSFFAPRSSRQVDAAPASPTPGEVDAILEKISAVGLHTLTERERQVLRRAAKK